MATCRETGAGSPLATPASIRASATKNTYAGPDPDRPVTASSNSSGTSTTVPTAPNTEVAHWTSSGEANGPPATADAPEPRRAGVFGIARTTTTWLPNHDPRLESRTPAAIDNTRVTPAAANCPQTVRASSGLTASTAPCDGTTEADTVIDGKRCSSSRRTGSSFSVTASSPSVAQPDEVNPASSAVPIRPPPTTTSRALTARRLPPAPLDPSEMT